MITIQLDGQALLVPPGSTLGSIIPSRDPACCVAVIRPGTQEAEQSRNYQVLTSAGEIRIEIQAAGMVPLEQGDFLERLKLHWEDRYSAAFGPFSTTIVPDRRPHRYERGDLIVGCGGYNPEQSYLVFSRMRHSADHGAGVDGGVIGRVVAGMGVLDRWKPGDRITGITQVISWADTSRSFTTCDANLLIEEGMNIVSHVDIRVRGYTDTGISTATARSVEHLLLTLERGRFEVSRAASTHIFNNHKIPSDVPLELRDPRREGTVTVRTRGQARGGVFIYTKDVPSSPAHTVVAQVTHGIEIARLAKEQDIFCIRATPARFDLVGLPLEKALDLAKLRNIDVTVDKKEGERVVVAQDPPTTLEVLAKKSVSLTTEPFGRVIDISLDDAKAPDSCRIFRLMTGLWSHDVGSLPAFFIFDDVYLFKPDIPKGVTIIPENTPHDEVPAGTLAITNEARKGVGLIGVRTSSNREFGPTSEPFDGTNVIGRVLSMEKLGNIKEKDTVFIREVKV